MRTFWHIRMNNKGEHRVDEYWKFLAIHNCQIKIHSLFIEQKKDMQFPRKHCFSIYSKILYLFNLGEKKKILLIKVLKMIFSTLNHLYFSLKKKKTATTARSFTEKKTRT